MRATHRLVVTGVLAVALVFAVLAFASVVFKEYLLTVSVFNFDSSSIWKSLGWYDDNAELVNGQWENQSLGSFVSSGEERAIPFGLHGEYVHPQVLDSCHLASAPPSPKTVW